MLFTVANRLDEVFNQFPEAPRVFILKYRPTFARESPPAYRCPDRMSTMLMITSPRCGRTGTPAPRARGSPPPLQREAFVQRYLSVDCIDPYRLGQQRIVVDERAVFRQRDHRKHQRAPFVSSGEGLADLGISVGGRCHESHNYLAR